MYQVIKTTTHSNGKVDFIVISQHKQEQAAKNKCRKLAGAGFSICWGVSYEVKAPCRGLNALCNCITCHEYRLKIA